MYVEDVFLQVREHLFFWRPDPALSGWHQNFIHDVGNHVRAGKPLSTNQAQTILKLLAHIRHSLIGCGMVGADELDQMLRHPQFRRPLYESANIPREVRYLGDNILGFRFKRNDAIVTRIKELALRCTKDWQAMRHHSPHPQFHWGQRIWLVPVTRHNINAIVTLINEYRFDTDAAVMAYLRLARQSRDRASAFAVAEDGVMLANVCDNPILAGWVTEVSDGVVL